MLGRASRNQSHADQLVTVTLGLLTKHGELLLFGLLDSANDKIDNIVWGTRLSWPDLGCWPVYSYRDLTCLTASYRFRDMRGIEQVFGR